MDVDVNKYMKRWLITIIFISLLQFTSLLNVCEGDMKIIKEKIIEISNDEARRLGYDLDNMKSNATKHNTPWNECLPKDSDDYEIERKKNELKNKEYWAVYYYLDIAKVGIGHKGGGLCIFIDSDSGEIITKIGFK